MPVWRDYEEEIFAQLQAKAEPGASVEFDVKLPGQLSRIDRQIDVVVEGRFAGGASPENVKMAVDCKCWSRNVDVSDVEGFIGLVEDVGTELGLLITTSGYSEAAVTRAKAARGIQVDVVTFEELESWRPDVEPCQICELDYDSDKMPGMMHLERFAPGGIASEERVFVGLCDRCQALHFRCPCGTTNGLYDSESGETECQGCGRSFFVVEVAMDRDGIVESNPHDRFHLTAPQE